MADFDALLQAEFGVTGATPGTRRYTNLKTQEDLQRAFEIMDDVKSIETSLSGAAAAGQLDRIAAKQEPPVTPEVYVAATVAEAIKNAHAKANVLHTYLSSLLNQHDEDGHSVEAGDVAPFTPGTVSSDPPGI